MRLTRADAYSILGLQEGCSDDDIRKAYKLQALKWHPDKNKNSTESTERFKSISEAYARLKAQNDDDDEFEMDEDMFDDDMFDDLPHEFFFFFARMMGNQRRAGYTSSMYTSYDAPCDCAQCRMRSRSAGRSYRTSYSFQDSYSYPASPPPRGDPYRERAEKARAAQSKEESEAIQRWLQTTLKLKLVTSSDYNIQATLESCTIPSGCVWEASYKRDLDPAASWTSVAPKKNGNIYAGSLRPGTDYLFRARPGKSGTYTWSGQPEYSSIWGPEVLLCTTGIAPECTNDKGKKGKKKQGSKRAQEEVVNEPVTKEQPPATQGPTAAQEASSTPKVNGKKSQKGKAGQGGGSATKEREPSAEEQERERVEKEAREAAEREKEEQRKKERERQAALEKAAQEKLRLEELEREKQKEKDRQAAIQRAAADYDNAIAAAAAQRSAADRKKERDKEKEREKQKDVQDNHKQQKEREAAHARVKAEAKEREAAEAAAKAEAEAALKAEAAAREKARAEEEARYRAKAEALLRQEGDRKRAEKRIGKVMKPTVPGTAQEGPTSGNPESVGPPPDGLKHTEPCKYFMRGQCMRGDSCWYVHDQAARSKALGQKYVKKTKITPVTSPSPAPPSASAQVPTIPIPQHTTAPPAPSSMPSTTTDQGQTSVPALARTASVSSTERPPPPVPAVRQRKPATVIQDPISALEEKMIAKAIEESLRYQQYYQTAVHLDEFDFPDLSAAAPNSKGSPKPPPAANSSAEIQGGADGAMNNADSASNLYRADSAASNGHGTTHQKDVYSSLSKATDSSTFVASKGSTRTADTHKGPGAGHVNGKLSKHEHRDGTSHFSGDDSVRSRKSRVKRAHGDGSDTDSAKTGSERESRDGGSSNGGHRSRSNLGDAYFSEGHRVPAPARGGKAIKDEFKPAGYSSTGTGTALSSTGAGTTHSSTGIGSTHSSTGIDSTYSSTGIGSTQTSYVAQHGLATKSADNVTGGGMSENGREPRRASAGKPIRPMPIPVPTPVPSTEHSQQTGKGVEPKGVTHQSQHHVSQAYAKERDSTGVIHHSQHHVPQGYAKERESTGVRPSSHTDSSDKSVRQSHRSPQVSKPFTGQHHAVPGNDIHSSEQLSDPPNKPQGKFQGVKSATPVGRMPIPVAVNAPPTSQRPSGAQSSNSMYSNGSAPAAAVQPVMNGVRPGSSHSRGTTPATQLSQQPPAPAVHDSPEEEDLDLLTFGIGFSEVDEQIQEELGNENEGYDAFGNGFGSFGSVNQSMAGGGMPQQGSLGGYYSSSLPSYSAGFTSSSSTSGPAFGSSLPDTMPTNPAAGRKPTNDRNPYPIPTPIPGSSFASQASSNTAFGADPQARGVRGGLPPVGQPLFSKISASTGLSATFSPASHADYSSGSFADWGPPTPGGTTWGPPTTLPASSNFKPLTPNAKGDNNAPARPKFPVPAPLSLPSGIANPNHLLSPSLSQSLMSPAPKITPSKGESVTQDAQSPSEDLSPTAPDSLLNLLISHHDSQLSSAAQPATNVASSSPMPKRLGPSARPYNPIQAQHGQSLTGSNPPQPYPATPPQSNPSTAPPVTASTPPPQQTNFRSFPHQAVAPASGQNAGQNVGRNAGQSAVANAGQAAGQSASHNTVQPPLPKTLATPSSEAASHVPHKERSVPILPDSIDPVPIKPAVKQVNPSVNTPSPVSTPLVNASVNSSSPAVNHHGTVPVAPVAPVLNPAMPYPYFNPVMPHTGYGPGMAYTGYGGGYYANGAVGPGMNPGMKHAQMAPAMGQTFFYPAYPHMVMPGVSYGVTPAMGNAPKGSGSAQDKQSSGHHSSTASHSQYHSRGNGTMYSSQ